VAVAFAIAFAIIAIQLYAALQVRQGKARWVWLVRPYLLIVPALFFGLALAGIPRDPFTAIAFGSLGLFYGAAVFTLHRRMTGRIASAPPGTDLSIDVELDNAVADFQVKSIGVILMFAGVAVVVLIGVGIWIAIHQ